MRCQQFDRDVNEAIVHITDHHAGFASHGGVGSMPRELVAKDSVFGVVRTATDDVARVKIAHNKGNSPRDKPPFNLLAQKPADVTQPDVSRRIALVSSISQQLLSCAFGDGNDCMAARHNPLFQCGEKSTFPLQSERLYQAIKGNGGMVRFVSLPHEAHGYAARESVEHALYEMATWLDRHVKNARE